MAQTQSNIKKYLHWTLDNINIVLASIGLVLFIIGLLFTAMTAQYFFFAMGVTFLAFGALLDKEYFFAGVQILILLAILLVFSGLGMFMVTFAAIIFTLVFAVSYYRAAGKEIYSIEHISALIGLILFMTALIFNAKMILGIGAVAFAIYASLRIKHQHKTAWVFLGLYALLALISFFSNAQ